jgi:WD40 repeat protein
VLAVASLTDPERLPRAHAGEHSGAVDVWTADGQKCLYTLQTHRNITSLAWSPDNKTLATGSADAIRLWNADTGKLEVTLLGPGIHGSLALSPSGHYRAGPGIEQWLVYVAQLEDGSQVTLTPEEFAKKYPWKNNPDKVR